MPHALILGASRGLGLGLVREFAGRGWTVTGTVRKQADMAAVTEAGGTAAMADVTDPASLAALKPAAKLDLLFVNAGIKQPGDVADITPEGIAHLFLTNAVAPVRAAEALLPHLTEDGMIAFMSSRLGSVALTEADRLAMYCASKAALNSLTRSMMARLDHARPVLTLHPGWVRTDMGGEDAAIDVQTSVKGLADVIESHRGKAGSAFIDYSGSELPW